MDTVVFNAGGVGAAVDLLRDGQVVAFPTETVYGLGADARNSNAVARIFAAKDRPQFNPLIVHLADVSMISQVAKIPDAASTLITLWPGPLTLVLPLRHDSGLSPLVTAGLDTVAIRIPANPLAQELLRAFGGPVAAPSANPSGKVSATSAAHVLAGLTGRIAAVLDGGDCKVGLESTIVGFDKGEPVLLRPGGVPVETIEAAIGEKLQRRKTDAITAPGQMESHYAPDVSVRLNAQQARSGEGWLGFGPNTRIAPGLNLSANGNLTEAAQNLFDAIRKMDTICQRHGLKGFAVAPIPETGLGLAINDRLRRAAAPRGT